MDYISLSEDSGERDCGFFLRRFVGTGAAATLNVPHRHDFQEILLFQAGHGRHIIDGQQVDVRPRTVCLVARGHVHVIEQVSGLKGWMIRFSDDFLPAGDVSRTWNYHLTLLNQLGPNRNLRLRRCEMRDLEIVLELLETEYANNTSVQRESALRHLLSLLLIRIERLYQSAVSANRGQHDDGLVYQQFMTLLEREFANHHDVQYYAKALRLPPHKLSKILGSILGKSTKQLIEERLILEAKRYLRYGDLYVKEIAFELGYNDLFHLSKTFKRLVGVPPQAFRDQRQKTP